MDKTNLITIISSEQTDYGKIIRESNRLSEFNICIQNLLYYSKLEIDNKLFKNVIVAIFSKDDSVENKTIKNMLNTLSIIKCPVFILLEENNNTDDIKMYFAENGLVPSEWGGDVDFVNKYDTDEFNFNLEDGLYLHLRYE